MELSTAPSWDGSGLVAAPGRACASFSSPTGDGYRVMPGGLTRVSPDAGGRFISMQRGGSSKDTWVTSGTPVEEITLLHAPDQNVELRRTGNNLPSRLADNFFWLGRYSERADATARLLRSALLRFNPERDRQRAAAARAAAADARNAGPVARAFWKSRSCARTPRRSRRNCSRPSSIRRAPAACGSIADHLQRLAMLVRDRTSNDMWRVVEPAQRPAGHAGRPAWSCSRATPSAC